MAVGGPSPVAPLTRDALRSMAAATTSLFLESDAGTGGAQQPARWPAKSGCSSSHDNGDRADRADRAEARRARWDLEWHRGMLELFRLGVLDALAMPDLAQTDPDPAATDISMLEQAYGERADPSLVHPWRAANFAAYLEEGVCRAFSHLLTARAHEPNPVTGVAQCDWRDRLAHLHRLLPKIRALPQVSWNQAEWDAGQDKWRSARRWDEDTELDLGDDASLTSAQVSAYHRFHTIQQETHLIDPRAAFDSLQDRLVRILAARTPVSRQQQQQQKQLSPSPPQTQPPPQSDGDDAAAGVPSVDDAVGHVLQSHHAGGGSTNASASALRSPLGSRVSRRTRASKAPSTATTRRGAPPAAAELPDTPPDEGIQDRHGGAVGGLFNGSISSIGRSVSLPARSDMDVFGIHHGGGLAPALPAAGPVLPLPRTADAVAAGTARKIATIAPAHRVVESLTEVSAYLASASYVASLCGPPLRDMAYGVIIVPAGEEALLLGNWRDSGRAGDEGDDVDDDHHHNGAGFKRKVLEKSRVVRASMKERERQMTGEAREEARDRKKQEELRAEEDRLDAMRMNAVREQRPRTPSAAAAIAAAASSAVPAPVPASVSAPAPATDEEPPKRGSSDGAPAVPVLPPPPTTPRTPPRISHEARPSLSLFPRRSTSTRDGPRSPLASGLQPSSASPRRSGSGSAAAGAGVQQQRPPTAVFPLAAALPPSGRQIDSAGGELQRRQSMRTKDSGEVVVMRSEWDREPRRRHLSKEIAGDRIGVGVGERGAGFKARLGRLRERLGLS